MRRFLCKISKKNIVENRICEIFGSGNPRLGWSETRAAPDRPRVNQVLSMDSWSFKIPLRFPNFVGRAVRPFFLPDKIKIHFLWSVSLFKVNLKSGKESFNGNQSRINIRSQPLGAVHIQFIDFLILSPTLWRHQTTDFQRHQTQRTFWELLQTGSK